MNMDIDKIFQEKIDTYYRILVSSFSKKFNKANDKWYAINELEGRARCFLGCKFDNPIEQDCFNFLIGYYNMGDSIEEGIKEYRSNRIKSYYIISIMNEAGEEVPVDTEPEYPSQTDYKNWLENISDFKITVLFAKYIALNKYNKNIEMQKSTLFDEKGEFRETPLNEEISSPNDEFTMNRQVMAMYFLLKYIKIENVDNTNKAKFIEFLTQKNYSNIYRKIRNPFEGNLKWMIKDLNYIRKFFENLKLSEVVKMIDKKIANPME